MINGYECPNDLPDHLSENRAKELLTFPLHKIIRNMDDWRIQSYLEQSSDWERKENEVFQLGSPNFKKVYYRHNSGTGSPTGRTLSK